MWKRIRRWGDWTVLALVVFWALSLTVNARRETARQSVVGRSLQILVSPAVSFTDTVSKFFFHLALNQFEGDRLRADNAGLRYDLTETRLQLSDERDTSDHLRRVMGLAEAPSLADKRRLVLAEVIGYGRQSSPGVLLVSRGSLDGVREGQPVVHGDALVGVVRGEPTRSAAFVELLIDPASMVFGTLRESRVRGIIRGRGEQLGGLELEFQPTLLSDEIEAGQEIVTSGLSGALIPGGLRIGVIKRVVVNEFGQRIAIAHSVAELATIEEVVILTDIEEAVDDETTVSDSQPTSPTATRREDKKTTDSEK